MKKRNQFIQLLSIAVLLFTFATACDKTDDPGGDFPSAGTVKDADGNKYNTVKIGTQVWMVENLKTTKYNDGTAIHNIIGDKAWENFTSGAYCWYDNDEEAYKNIYGALYNWHAVNSGKLAPKGWRVPTDDDWTLLEEYLSSSGSVVKALAAKTGWDCEGFDGPLCKDPTTNNSSGFTAMPGGGRYDGGFGGVGQFTIWWSSTTNISNLAWARQLSTYGDFYRDDDTRYCGFSVRCVKD